jgi:hypothetical protein
MAPPGYSRLHIDARSELVLAAADARLVTVEEVIAAVTGAGTRALGEHVALGGKRPDRDVATIPRVDVEHDKTARFPARDTDVAGRTKPPPGSDLSGIGRCIVHAIAALALGQEGSLPLGLKQQDLPAQFLRIRQGTRYEIDLHAASLHRS